MSSTNAKFEVVRDLAKKINTEATALENEIQQFTSDVEGKIGAAGSEAWGGDSAEAASPVFAKIKQDIAQLKALGEDFSSDASASMAGLEQQGTQSVGTIQNVYQTKG